MRGGNAGRALGTTLGVAAIVLGARGAAAQVAASPQTLQRPGVNIAERTPSPVPPAPDATMRAFQAVASWVKEWKVGAPENLPAAAGAYVTLRLDGQIVGRGMELSAGAGGDAACIVRAAAQAIEEARRRVPIEHDALFDENLRAIGPRIAITLELAGALVPFAPKEYADAAADVAPGIEGVAVRAGERTAAMFPEQMLATGTDAGAGLSALVAKLTDDPGLGLKKPAELAAERAMVFYRFRTSTIGQAKAGAGATFFTRGGRVVRQSDMTQRELARWADELAAHLIPWMSARSDADRPLLRSTLDPVPGSVDDSDDPEQWLLISLALNQYCEAAAVQSATALHARRHSGDLFRAASDRLLDIESVPPGLWALAAVRTRQGNVPPDHPMGIRFRKMLDRAEDRTWAQPRERARPEERGLVALAEVTRPEGESLVRATFREVAPGDRVAQMPWLGLAELALHPTDQLPSAVALREMRSLVWQHQLKSEDLPPDQQDLAGGIVFTASKRGQALPTWQAARPLAFIATMLGDERLTSDAEVPAELSRLLASLRFLRQLTADEAAGHLYANPALALGGVRASPFDQRMPPEATALTLMTVCETLQSLEKIRKRREGAGPPMEPQAK